MVFSKRLAELRSKNKMTQQELADKIGVSRGTIGMYEIGRRDPDTDTLVKIAKIFNVTIDYILGEADTPRPKLKESVVREIGGSYHASNAAPAEMITLPILGDIRAGKPLFAEEHVKGQMPFPKQMLTQGYDHFLLKIDGDSMTGDGIDPNDIVLIRVQNYIDYSNQIAAVIINSCEACIKHVIHPEGSDMVILRSSNTKYPDIVHPANDLIVNGVYAGVFKAPKNGI